MERICNRDNLNNAYLKVKRNKGAAGIDGMTIEASLEFLKSNKDKLKFKYNLAFRVVKTFCACAQIIAACRTQSNSFNDNKINRIFVEMSSEISYLRFRLWQDRKN